MKLPVHLYSPGLLSKVEHFQYYVVKLHAYLWRVQLCVKEEKERERVQT